MAAPIVLYVEDEEGDLTLMQLAFKRVGLGSALHSVPDGKNAIQYLAGENSYADRQRHPMPAVLLLDLNLPVVSGFQVMEWMRHRPELKDLAVIVFSSSTLPVDKDRAKELGAKEFIEKPSSARGFGEVVKSLKEHWLTERS